MPRRFVLTGAPGAGKTVLAEALRGRGWAVVPEAATDVIAAGQAAGVDEPWEHDGFLDSIVAVQRRRQLEADAGGAGVQVYDRSPLCTLALARYLQRPVTALLAAEVARVVAEVVYERDVFLVRPLGFVTPTAARRISYPDSLAFESVHRTVYLEYGFHLLDVPAGDVGVRADLVERHLRSPPPST